ncbi:DUF4158 domain-containing protein [Streptomyces sp. S1A(2023)]
MLRVVWGLRWVVTSIERTAYPRFKRLITAHELHLFFSPSRDELEWAADVTDCDEHLLALLLMLKSYRRMGCFPALEEVPEMVVEAGLELPGFSTFDKMASKIRTEVNASICTGIHDRMSAAQRAGLMRLLEDRDSDGRRCSTG